MSRAALTAMQRLRPTWPSCLAAAGCVFAAAVIAPVPAPGSPASAQALPPCGSEQMEPRLENLPRLVYAGHTYWADLQLDQGAAPPGYTAVNVQVTGTPGAVRKVPDEQAVELAPQAGTLALTVSWDQEDSLDRPVCSAIKTLDVQVLAPLPLTIEPYRLGTSAQFAGFGRNGFGISFTLTPGELPPFHGYRQVVDLAPVRVEARAVAGAKRPSQAVEPAVLEYVPGARRPQRARRGLVKIVRRELNPTADDGVETVKLSRSGAPGPRLPRRERHPDTRHEAHRQLRGGGPLLLVEQFRADHRGLRLQRQARLALGPVQKTGLYQGALLHLRQVGSPSRSVMPKADAWQSATDILAAPWLEARSSRC